MELERELLPAVVVRIGIGEPTWGMAKLLSEGHGRGLQGTEGEGGLEFWDVLVMIFSIFFHLLIHCTHCFYPLFL